MSAPERIWAWTYKLPHNRKDGTRSWVPFAPQFKPWVINDWPGWKFWQTRRTEYYQSATEYIRADLAHPTLADALALPEVKALVEAASQLSRAVDSSFYPEDRGGYETVEQMREVHAKEREVAIQTYVGARDAEEALTMSHRSALSVIRGAKARINDMLTDLDAALTAINNKV